jgi:hypothetical protein
MNIFSQDKNKMCRKLEFKFARNVTFLFCCFLKSNIIFSQVATTIYNKISPSTVTIETNKGLGSGFFVAPNIIATNYHVIEGASYANCYTNEQGAKYEIDGYLAVDKNVDLVLLQVSKLNKPALQFAVTSPAIGQNIYVVGSPKGLPATISEGIVSGLRDLNNYKLIQMTAPISPGSSGGPVVNSNGELIGISVSQLRDGQNLNFAIPKSYLEILLSFKSDNAIKIASLNLNEELQVFSEMIDSYGIEIFHFGGIGSHQIQIQAFYLTDHGYLDDPKSRINYFFNNAGNLWITPIPGYKIENLRRYTDEEEMIPLECEDNGYCYLEILNKMQNKFYLIMKKTTFEDYIENKNKE